MAARLGLGIIGLGRRWPRYRRALVALRDDAHIRAVCDARAVRAEEEARSLGCEAVGGVVELVERDDVDAVLLLSGAWDGLWPLTAASHAGKPVYCAVPPTCDEGYLDQVMQGPGPANRVMLVPSPALGLVRDTLLEQVRDSLGPVSLLHATWVSPRAQPKGGVLATPAALALLSCSAALCEASPVRVQAVGGESSGFATLVLPFASGQQVQLTLWMGPAARSACELRLETENGMARAELPGLLEWRDSEGRHQRHVPGGLSEMLWLDRFFQMVRDEAGPCSSLEEACQALTWLRAARQSLAEGGPVELAPDPGENWA